MNWDGLFCVHFYTGSSSNEELRRLFCLGICIAMGWMQHIDGWYYSKKLYIYRGSTGIHEKGSFILCKPQILGTL
jgi:hypothetical protein